jgi:hypothetical protein
MVSTTATMGRMVIGVVAAAGVGVRRLCLVEAGLIFGFPIGLVGQGRLIDGCRQVADGRARAGLGNVSTDENSQH